MTKPWEGRRIHLVGIGGAGMSGYARVAAQLGATVSGSDREESPALEHLRAMGIDAYAGHDAANVPSGADVFVSTAIPADNPERIPGAQPRAELLRELSALKTTVAIAGAHGKTTTTSMAAHVLLRCGLEPAYLIGGALRTTGEHADWGAGDVLVVEADESDRSMLALEADVAVVLNVEHDHHATFGSLEEVRAVFRAFLAAAPQAVLPGDDPPVRALRHGEAVTFTTPLVAGDTFIWRGEAVTLAVPGIHNARNAVAALEACALVGADPAQAAVALADFAGAGRRFEVLGTTPEGATVVDDYAHHPTEVAATIAAARGRARGRVVAIFQPHLYSRTQRLAHEFGIALAAADLVAVLDVYPARERPGDFPGIDGRTIAQAVADAGSEVLWLPTVADAEAALRLRDGDLVLTMGAGDIDALGRALVSHVP